MIRMIVIGLLTVVLGGCVVSGKVGVERADNGKWVAVLDASVDYDADAAQAGIDEFTEALRP